MKKICFVTAARSEYGLLKWIMKEVQLSSELQLQLIVTGGHLLQEQGYTIDQIVSDGFYIDAIVDINLDTSSKVTIASSMGRLAEQIAKVIDNLNPDMLVVLGDRYELLPICSTAFIMRIPIAHISGGDVTEGAIDDGVRNAVSMLASYHFPGTKDCASNIARMLNGDECIWTVGEPGLDAFYREKLMSRFELAESIGLNEEKKWILMTYHPETTKGIEYNLEVAKNCGEILMDLDGYQVVVTYANADFGGRYINEYWEELCKMNPKRMVVVPSLGQMRYLSFMKQVDFVIGNSSSGIIEAPALSVPVINIGDRQKGRYLCGNIIQSSTNKSDIAFAVQKAIKMDRGSLLYSGYWGDGRTAEKIVQIISSLC